MSMKTWRIAYALIHTAVGRWGLGYEETPDRRRDLANLELEASLKRRRMEEHTNKPRDSHGRDTKRSAAHRA